jgi:hypothetical protein
MTSVNTSLYYPNSIYSYYKFVRGTELVILFMRLERRHYSNNCTELKGDVFCMNGKRRILVISSLDSGIRTSSSQAGLTKKYSIIGWTSPGVISPRKLASALNNLNTGPLHITAPHSRPA